MKIQMCIKTLIKGLIFSIPTSKDNVFLISNNLNDWLTGIFGFSDIDGQGDMKLICGTKGHGTRHKRRRENKVRNDICF